MKNLVNIDSNNYKKKSLSQFTVCMCNNEESILLYAGKTCTLNICVCVMLLSRSALKHTSVTGALTAM